MVGPHLPGKIETRVRCADRNHRRGASQASECDRAEPDGADALDDDGIAQPDLRALGDVHRRQEAASPADVVFERDRVRQTRHGHARLEIDGLRPAAEQSFVCGIGDPVHPSSVAARRRAMNGTGTTASARAMNVEEDDAVAFTQSRSVEAFDRAAHGVDRSGRDVARDDRIGHARKTAMPQVHVRTADLGARRPQQCCAVGQIRPVKFPDFDRLMRAWHDRGKDALAHRVTLSLL